MIIENAERFGLSQLHQLRGRVGRGTEESWCFLLSEHSEKLNILCQTNDGFMISQKDLEIRGPGDLLGTRQSGDADIRLQLTGDTQILEEVSAVVQHLYKDPDQAENLSVLKKNTMDYFAQSEHTIALN